MYHTPDERQTELLDFGMRLNDNIAAGNCDPYLRVANRDGAHPIVAALGSEPVARLWRRIAAIGGRANVFVKSGDEVTAFVSDIGTADKHVAVWENDGAPVDLLIDAAARGNGVLLAGRAASACRSTSGDGNGGIACSPSCT